MHRGSGSDKTIGYAQTRTWCSRSSSSSNGYRPVLVIDSLNDNKVNEIVNFLKQCQVRILNVAGHRQSSSNVTDFEQKVKKMLILAFKTHLDMFKKIETF